MRSSSSSPLCVLSEKKEAGQERPRCSVSAELFRYQCEREHEKDHKLGFERDDAFRVQQVELSTRRGTMRIVNEMNPKIANTCVTSWP